MTQQDVKVALDVVVGMLQLNSLQVHTLIDHSATLLFTTNKIMKKFGGTLNKIKQGFTISTSLDEVVDIDHVYKRVIINRYEMKVDLIHLQLHDFDLIFGMNWLGTYQARMDSFVKTITLQGLEGKRITFKGEINSILNCMILVITTKKLL